MNTFKNILIGLGAITLVLLILLLIFGIKVLGTVFVWFVGIVFFLFIVGWIIYSIGKAKGKRTEE